VALPSKTAEKGAGDSYVAKHYPKQVEAHRSRVSHTQAALIVHMDADPKNTVEARMNGLNQTLLSLGMPPRGTQERIANLIPKRNIETWIHFYLEGPPIDETTGYSKYKGSESECWPAAESFSDDAASNTRPPGAPPSLEVGLSEFQRVL
jgi:hypothetical protein